LALYPAARDQVSDSARKKWPGSSLNWAGSAPSANNRQPVDLDAGGGFLGHINIHAIVVHFIGSAPWT